MQKNWAREKPVAVLLISCSTLLFGHWWILTQWGIICSLLGALAVMHWLSAFSRTRSLWIGLVHCQCESRPEDQLRCRSFDDIQEAPVRWWYILSHHRAIGVPRCVLVWPFKLHSNTDSEMLDAAPHVYNYIPHWQFYPDLLPSPRANCNFNILNKLWQHCGIHLSAENISPTSGPCHVVKGPPSH